MTLLARLRTATTPLLLSVLTVALTVVVELLGDASLQRIVLGALINMIAVVGIYLFVGLTGTFSFGQLGFMAIGAYATAVMTVPVATKRALFSSMPDWLVEISVPFPLATVLSGLLAAVVALLLSFPMARMQPLTAGLATLSILVAVYVLAGNWSSVTNGSKGMSAIPTGSTTTVILLVLVLVLFAVWFFQQSTLGLRIRAVREDEVAARSIGIKVGRERGIAFVASGFVMGVAGSLYAQLQGNLAPGSFYLNQTFLLVAMLVVGGMTTLTGAVLGTIVITALRRLLQVVEAGVEIGPLEIPGRPGLTEVGIGVALLLVLAFRPGGLTRGREWRPTLRRRRTADRAADTQEVAA